MPLDEQYRKPTKAELEKWAEANEAAAAEIEKRRKLEADMEAARVAKRKEQEEEAFKRQCRAKYATLADEDFERLWPQIRDQEVLLRAAAAYERKRAQYDSF